MNYKIEIWNSVCIDDVQTKRIVEQHSLYLDKLQDRDMKQCVHW